MNISSNNDNFRIKKIEETNQFNEFEFYVRLCTKHDTAHGVCLLESWPSSSMFIILLLVKNQEVYELSPCDVRCKHIEFNLFNTFRQFNVNFNRNYNKISNQFQYINFSIIFLTSVLFVRYTTIEFAGHLYASWL